jgi:ParB family chromosome partitioning protein
VTEASAQLVPIADIQIGERDRSDLGNVAELADSIKAVGLLHPVVVTASLELVAGGRRLAAVQSLGWTETPVTVVDLASASDVLRAELEENTCRKSLSPMEASFARERRARVLAPKVQENKGGRPVGSGESDIPQDGFWEEPGATETAAKFAAVSPPPAKAETRKVAAIGTGYSHTSIDKVDEIRRVAERGVTTIGAGKDRREVEVPEPVREIARQQLPALAKTGAAIDPASKAVRRAVEEHVGKDPDVRQARLLKAYFTTAKHALELLALDAPDVAAAIDASSDRSEQWDELERLQRSVNQWFDNVQQARQKAGLRVLGGGK